MPDSFPTIRLLYVDDDVALVRYIQRALSRRGFEVTHAKTRQDALEHITAGGADVVALDHYLPEGTGLDLLVSLAAIEGAPAVVYVTGSSEAQIAVAALKAGASDFVAKTVDADFLILLESALKQAVQRSRLRSQKEAAEREVRLARDRAEMLLGEVNHRVANSLSLVGSIINLQSKAVTNPEARNALSEAQARIYAISLVHKHLYNSGDVRYVDLEDYLSGLLEQLQTSMQADGFGTKLTYQLTPIKLRTDTSISLGIIVAEWVTNAFKYAYPAGGGEVRINLARLDEGTGELTVVDDGVGRALDGTTQGTGLGTRIVRATAQGMRADVEYVDASVGTTARIRFPLGLE
jgi:two-component sensor histidine kinase/CheY-like chemotaxis protein